ncbi:hypothetical protein PITC_075520 [Penicillium italicum]|uniref:Myb-like DNA-binding domain-containing protein n=1 Tax=Penicillium italicum TaxID=40296 RepID=A0A0A2KWC4_PENIT|nr:hypothetical protein PITC_075520 [Penicillium italicum]
MTKSPPATRKRQATKHNLRDEEVMLLWKLAKPNYKEAKLADLAKELNLSVGAARMRWARLKAKLEAFERKVNETAAADAAVGPIDTTMENVEVTKGAEDSKPEGVNGDKDTK